MNRPLDDERTESPAAIPPSLFETSATAERRHVLAVLAETDGPLERTDLAEIVARRTGGAARDVRISLTHVHLPALVDEGLLEWDPRSKTVVATERGAALTVVKE